MDPTKAFELEVKENINSIKNDVEVKRLSVEWIKNVLPHKYSYNFQWLGRPIIQYPQDLIALQEIIWRVKPEVIVETGIAHGGSLIFYASMCELIGHGKVVGIDIDIRPHNRNAIQNHPMYKRIELIQGSSVSQDVIDKVKNICEGKRALVVLDSNHTHDHVLAELNAYAPLVASGSYCIVFDTIVEDLPKGTYPDRPWDVGNNPKTAVHAFLANNDDFCIDEDIQASILITAAPDGYLRRR